MKAIKNLLGGLLLVIILIIMDREIGEERPMQKKHTGKWMLFCILALAVLGLANKCVNAQVVSVFYAALDEHIQGQTVCNNDQEIAILVNSRIDTKDTAILGLVIRHEMVHVAQVRKIGNCQLANDEYQKNPLLKEIPAYCEQLFYVSKKTGDSLGTITQFVTFMTNQYGKKLKLSFDDVLNLTDKLCLSRRNNDSS